MLTAGKQTPVPRRTTLTGSMQAWQRQTTVVNLTRRCSGVVEYDDAIYTCVTRTRDSEPASPLTGGPASLAMTI
jgi:hypothetical protein